VSVPPVKWKVVQSAVQSDFWSGLSTWEPTTFRRYLQYIDRTTTLVDFGTWIGPTILYGGHLAGRSFGIEADPGAYAEVLMNLKLNHATLRNVHIQPACVAVEQSSMTMRTASAGNSCSGLGAVSCGTPRISWKVQCYELPFLFRTWNISLDENTFIKMDIESYECTLLPRLVDWFLTAKTKPTLHLAMHGNFAKCTSTQYKEIDRLVHGYKFGACVGSAKIQNLSTAVVENICNYGEILLSDVRPPL
jgi:FkbM family methyltransferase